MTRLGTLIGACLLVTASEAEAATIIQQVGFVEDLRGLFTPLVPTREIGTLNLFDPAIGVLTNVHVDVEAEGAIGFTTSLVATRTFVTSGLTALFAQQGLTAGSPPYALTLPQLQLGPETRILQGGFDPTVRPFVVMRAFGSASLDQATDLGAYIGMSQIGIAVDRTNTSLISSVYENGIFVGTRDSTPSVRGTATFTYTYTPTPTAIAEPATWALMIGGLGVAGAWMRYRRRILKFSCAPARFIS